MPVCVLEVAADTSDCINFMGIILIIQDADKAPSCARDGEGTDLGCPTFGGSSQMTVSFWENDFLFFFLSIREAAKTPQNPLTFNFHGGILDKSFNSELDCECYIDWV